MKEEEYRQKIKVKKGCVDSSFHATLGEIDGDISSDFLPHTRHSTTIMLKLVCVLDAYDSYSSFRNITD